jgi:predicted HicB family RNase H-like nuclease
MPAKPVALVLRLPPPLHAALKRRARAATRSLNNLIVMALTAYVRKGGTP